MIRALVELQLFVSIDVYSKTKENMYNIFFVFRPTFTTFEEIHFVIGSLVTQTWYLK